MKTYIGDGVYANIQHGAIVLTTEVGNGIPTNEIVFERETLLAFEIYIQKLKEKRII
jgi:hypothetical protein